MHQREICSDFPFKRLRISQKIRKLQNQRETNEHEHFNPSQSGRTRPGGGAVERGNLWRAACVGTAVSAEVIATFIGL